MSYIELDREKGLNPHMACCPRCGKENGELVLIGARKSIYKCNNCGVNIYGHRKVEPCPNCKEGGGRQPYVSSGFTHVGTIGEHDRIPTSLCDECEKELASFKEIVSAGGVYWKCSDCKMTGVIKKSPFADAVRATHKLDAPAPCGIEFSKKDCPACNRREENDGTTTVPEMPEGGESGQGDNGQPVPDMRGTIDESDCDDRL